PDKKWHAHRMANEAINMAMAHPCGPVHINIPLREPFYPEAHETFSFEQKIQLFDTLKTQTVLSEDSKLLLKASSEKFKRIMIVAGQQRPNPQIQAVLDKLM